MIKSNDALLLAHKYGYRVDESGVAYGTNGDVVGYIKDGDLPYMYIGLNIRKEDREGAEHKIVKNIRVHRLQAYQKFGDALFAPGVLVRHLNGNSLDNSIGNIAIGTNSDNMYDQSPEVRRRKAIGASSKIRKFTDTELQTIKDDSKIRGLSYTAIMKKWGIASKGTVSYMVNKAYVTSNP